MLLRVGRLKRTQRRSEHWKCAQFLGPAKTYSASWGLPTSTGNSFGTTVGFTSPLTRLTSVNAMFCWTEAHMAFLKIKQVFTTAFILIQPDPTNNSSWRLMLLIRRLGQCYLSLLVLIIACLPLSVPQSTKSGCPKLGTAGREDQRC